MKAKNQQLKISPRLQATVAYLFEVQGEMSNLELQKLLYYIQGLSFALNGKEMFEEDCQAWAHGEVYPNVYRTFKKFSANPMEGESLLKFKKYSCLLAAGDKKIIELVSDTFGNYSGKRLEQITHCELPWTEARPDLKEGGPSNETVTKQAICSYFNNINKLFDLSSEYGINNYIDERNEEIDDDEEVSDETLERIKAYEKAVAEGTLQTYSLDEVRNMASSIDTEPATTAEDVAKFLIQYYNNEEDLQITNLTLNKLLYFAQGHYLAKYNKLLFKEHFEPWKFGPVVPLIYRKYKSCGKQVIPDVYKGYNFCNHATLKEVQLLLDVVRHYKRYSGSYLIDLTHEADTPWSEAKRRKSDEIDNELIKKYFSKHELDEFKLENCIDVNKISKASLTKEEYEDEEENEYWENFLCQHKKGARLK